MKQEANKPEIAAYEFTVQQMSFRLVDVSDVMMCLGEDFSG